MHSIIIVRFGDKEIAKEEFYAAKRSINIKIRDVNVGNIVISKLVKIKANSKYLIGYLDEAIRPLVLIMPKMGGYVMKLKVKEGNKKLMSFSIGDEKLLSFFFIIIIIIYLFILQTQI